MLQNRIVIRYIDGRVLKGFTSDFIAGKDFFHYTEKGLPTDKPVQIEVSALKAIFFVKDHAGNPQHKERNAFDPSRPVAGRKISVRFRDGEEIVGLTQGYKPGRAGFFMVPADPLSNNERIYVVCSAAVDIKFV